MVVSVAKGYDLGYIWKTQGEAAGRPVGGYYNNAAQAGEPPGVQLVLSLLGTLRVDDVAE